MSMVINPQRFASAGGGTPTFVAAGALTNGNGATLAQPASLPTGRAVGDIAIVHYSYNDPNLTSPVVTSITMAAGWTPIGPQVDQLGMSGRSFWKRLDGTETTPNVTRAGGASSGARTVTCLVEAWRGCKASGDPFESAASNSGSSATMAGSSVTTTGVNRRVVSVYNQANGVAQTSVPDTGWTEDNEQTHAVSGGGAAVSSSIERVAAGSQAAESRPIAAARRWISHSFALLPT